MGIGKSHYDTNFRDKCYMVAALAHHADEVETLRPFVLPKAWYRDVRYGLAIGLGRRGKLDGIPLLGRLAVGDPISVIRRQARASLRAIQEKRRLAGDPVPVIRLSDPMPFEAVYPPRGLEWPEPVVVQRPSAEAPAAETARYLRQQIAKGLEADHFRDLNNSNNQAPGATRMMVTGIQSLSLAFTTLADEYPKSCGDVATVLLDSPYPFAQYLALRELVRGSCRVAEDRLIASLDKCAKATDTVRFYWTCEALAAQRIDRAIPSLVRFTVDDDPRGPYDPAGLHGPAGMGFGYPAAKAVARTIGQIPHPQVQRLLDSDNIWIRAGALEGLIEARAPGIEQLLTEMLKVHQPGLIRDHALVGLARLDDRNRCSSLGMAAGR
jgi:hypothetical protein